MQAGGTPYLEEQAVFSSLTNRPPQSLASLTVIEPGDYPRTIWFPGGGMVIVLTSYDPEFREVQRFHELFHAMLPPNTLDFQVEGLATKYAEVMFARYRWPWANPQSYFDSVPYSAHSTALYLVNDLMAATSERAVWSMVRFVQDDSYGGYINIDAWLLSLGNKQAAACAVLQRYHKNTLVYEAIRTINDAGHTMQFAVPTVCS